MLESKFARHETSITFSFMTFLPLPRGGRPLSERKKRRWHAQANSNTRPSGSQPQNQFN